MELKAYLGDTDLVPDQQSKPQEYFDIPVHIEVMFIVLYSLLNVQ